ncbi:MAG: hypothetical protein JST28_01565 [Acidobacteria bacterium]|nr:hypothetical protein [Acidobacteriota bacterium]
MKTMNKCAVMDETKLADMLLDESTADAKVKTHVAECASCREELEELRATMGLMDAWKAPEPSPYFMTRLNARMREEREAPRLSWFQRIRDRFTYGPQMHAGPLAATALTVMLLIGGGAYLGVTNVEQPVPQVGPVAGVVHDLQTLDSNKQVLDQLEAISDNPDDAISDDPNSDDPTAQ